MIESIQRDCLSEYRLDQHLLGIESETQRRQTQTHIAGCDSCRHAFDAMRYEREAFLAVPALLPEALQQAMAQMPEAFAPSPTPRDATAHQTSPLPTPHRHTTSNETSPSTSGAPQSIWALLQEWIRQWMSTLAVAAGVCALLLLPRWWDDTTPHTDAGTSRYIGTKGGTPHLMVALRRGSQIRLARMGEPFRHRDQLRLAYSWQSHGKAYLYVLHREPSNTLTPLYPNTTQAKSIPIITGHAQDLPGSLEVDDATHGREEIWACFSTRPLSYHTVRLAIPTMAASTQWQTQPRKPCDFLVRFYFTRKSP